MPGSSGRWRLIIAPLRIDNTLNGLFVVLAPSLIEPATRVLTARTQVGNGQKQSHFGRLTLREQEVPEPRSVGLGHEVACHLPADEQRRIWAELVKTQLAPAGPAEEA